MLFLFDLLWEISTIGFVSFALFIGYSLIKQSYWKRKGVPYVQPYPFLGSAYEHINTPPQQVEINRYFKYGPIYGYYEGNRPALSVGDPELLQDILVKDFSVFHSRRIIKVGDKIMDKTLLTLEGENWRRMRRAMTPTFSPKQFRRITSILKECALTLVQNLQVIIQQEDVIDVKKPFGAYTLDAIASAAFSTKIDSLNDPKNAFVQAALKEIETTFTWRFAILFIFPDLMKLFKISAFDSEASEYFKNLIGQVVEERRKTGQKTNDFLQLLIDASFGITNESNSSTHEDENDSLSIEEIAAQCVTFILTYHTTSSALSYIAFELARHEDIQDKVRQEVRECLKETNGEFTYDTFMNMKYLDSVIAESVRMHPVFSRHVRKASMNYKLGNTGIEIPKGTLVSIPISAMHKDPKFFPDPEKFDPNRFTPEEKLKRKPFTYMPFGEGPRMCIAMRLGYLMIKICLSYFLSRFNIKICPQTKIPIRFNASLNVVMAKDILLKLEPRKDNILLK